MRMLRMMLLIVGLSGFATAYPTTPNPTSVPEIDPGSATTAFALVSGTVLVLRGRRKG